MSAYEFGTISMNVGHFKQVSSQKYNLDLITVENFAPNPVPTSNFCPDTT
jgi:hypothetical protein